MALRFKLWLQEHVLLTAALIALAFGVAITLFALRPPPERAAGADSQANPSYAHERDRMLREMQ